MTSRTTRLAMIDTFEPIGLDELLDVAELQTREDRKYLVPIDAVDGLLERLDAPRALDIDGSRVFRYETTYYDTADLRSYLDAARRRPHRFKVRVRTYLDSASSTLEVTVRNTRGRTVKHRLRLDAADRGVLTPMAGAFVEEHTTIDRAAKVLGNTLTTSYTRSTILVDEGAARATVDTDLRWVASGGSMADLPAMALIETKTHGRSCTLDRILWCCGHRPTTVSKYCTGLAALRPDLPANKWHRVLANHFRTS